MPDNHIGWAPWKLAILNFFWFIPIKISRKLTGYHALDSILMIIMISRKKLEGHKIMRNTVLTQWFVNDGAAKDPPETRHGCFSGRRGKISCNYSPKLNLCMAGTTANLVYLRKNSQGLSAVGSPLGIQQVSGCSIINRPHGIVSSFLIW